MSRAFVKEAEDDEPVKLPDRPISPHPNLVTPEGLASIERTIDRFTAAYKAALGKHDKAAIAAAQRELRYWSTRLATAKLVQPSTDRTVVHFGTTVVVRRADGRMQTFRIVGEDEADPSRGTVSHVSPLARAVLGKAVGDVVMVLGREAEVLEIK
jgi:transcription elongation GreA/GreB family factor